MKWLGIAALVLVGVPLTIGVFLELFHSGGPAGLLLVGLVGLAFYERAERRKLAQRLDAELAAVRQDLASLRTAGPLARDAAAASSAPAEVPAAVVAAAEEAVVDGASTSSASLEVAALESLAVAGPEASPDAAPAWATATPLEPDERSSAVTASLGASILAWFKGGNTIVRVAVLILFVGVAFLLRYAAENALLPIELRIAGVAAGGLVLLVLGWRLRTSRRGYGLTLQGAGIGVLYMTVFAAMKLYGLLPVGAGFVLLVAIAALAAAIALLQDALPLAVVGFIGGFAAPLLASTGAGSHVLLFGYCAVLNLAIAWIASRKAWKLLNLVGFTCTSLIAGAWGATSWQPELLASTEPFLVAHVALYLWICVQYSRRLALPAAQPLPAWAMVRGVPIVDAGLVFGLPFVALGFQAVLVRHVPYALAASAAVMSAAYLLLGRWLWRQEGEAMRLFTEAMLAIGAVFLALVAPLALDARWTTAAWAIQGAGMVWVAVRQQRPWALAFGLLLQVLAALSFWAGPLDAGAARFVANAKLLAMLLLAASAFACARVLQRDAAGPRAEPVEPARSSRIFAPRLLRGLHWGALALGVVHLLIAGADELGRAPWQTPDRTQGLALWLAAVAVAMEALHRRLTWAELALPARPLLALAGLLALSHIFDGAIGGRGWNDLVPAGLIVLVVLTAAALWVLRRLDADAESAGEDAHVLRHALPFEGVAIGVFVMLQAGLMADIAVAHWVTESGGWRAGATMAAPTLVSWAVLAGLARARWPMDRHPAAWHAGLALPWLALLLLWSAVVNAFGDGAMKPLPYLPLANPIDLGHGLLLMYALRLRASLAGSTDAQLGTLARRFGVQLGWLTAAMAFWWTTSLLVRTLHHWAGTPMWFEGALDSGLVQMALSILWAAMALAAMFVAARRLSPQHARTVWLAGAGLLGVVVVKLLLVDLSHTSTLQRIGSFVGVGLLMLVVGYVAPLPPARKGDAEAAPDGR